MSGSRAAEVWEKGSPSHGSQSFMLLWAFIRVLPRQNIATGAPERMSPDEDKPAGSDFSVSGVGGSSGIRTRVIGFRVVRSGAIIPSAFTLGRGGDELLVTRVEFVQDRDIRNGHRCDKTFLFLGRYCREPNDPPECEKNQQGQDETGEQEQAVGAHKTDSGGTQYRSENTAKPVAQEQPATGGYYLVLVQSVVHQGDSNRVDGCRKADHALDHHEEQQQVGRSEEHTSELQS